jgi:hypothetical protein
MRSSTAKKSATKHTGSRTFTKPSEALNRAISLIDNVPADVLRQDMRKSLKVAWGHLCDIQDELAGHGL